MKKYICQLKNGNMLYRDDNKLFFEYTGYPYPDTEKSNVEMVKELVESEIPVSNPSEFYYNYVEVIDNYRKFMHAINRGCFVRDLAKYYVGDSTLVIDKFREHGLIKFYETDEYVILFSDHYKILLVMSRDEFTAKYFDVIYEDKHAETKVFSNTINYLAIYNAFDTDREDILALIDIAFSNINSSLFRNVDLSIQEFTRLLACYSGLSLSIYFDYDFFADTLSYVFKEYRHINISKDDILNILKLTGYMHSIFNENILLTLLRLKVNNYLGRERKANLYNNLNGSVVDAFIKAYGDYIFYSGGDKTKFEYIDGRFTLYFYWANTHVEDMYYESGSFTGTMSKYVLLPRFYTEFMKPTDVSDDKLVWDFNKCFAEDLIGLVPLVCRSVDEVTGIELGDTEDLLQGDNKLKLLSCMYRNIEDERSIIFHAEEYQKYADMLTFCYEDYCGKTDRLSSSLHHGDYHRKYIKYIPDSIIKSFGEFNSFARIFCVNSNLFKFDSSIVKERAGLLLYRYRFSYTVDVSRQGTSYNLDISKEMFESQLKYACIAEFLKVILISGDVDISRIKPISLNDIYVEFDEKTQVVYLQCRYSEV